MVTEIGPVCSGVSISGTFGLASQPARQLSVEVKVSLMTISKGPHISFGDRGGGGGRGDGGGGGGCRGGGGEGAGDGGGAGAPGGSGCAAWQLAYVYVPLQLLQPPHEPELQVRLRVCTSPAHAPSGVSLRYRVRESLSAAP